MLVYFSSGETYEKQIWNTFINTFSNSKLSKTRKKNRSENIYGFMGVLSPVHNAPSMIIYERGLNCLNCDARHGGDTRSHVVQSVPNSNGVKLWGTCFSFLIFSLKNELFSMLKLHERNCVSFHFPLLLVRCNSRETKVISLTIRAERERKQYYVAQWRRLDDIRLWTWHVSSPEIHLFECSWDRYELIGCLTKPQRPIIGPATVSHQLNDAGYVLATGKHEDKSSSETPLKEGDRRYPWSFSGRAIG